MVSVEVVCKANKREKEVNDLTPEQQTMMNITFTMLELEGVSHDEVERILSQEISSEVALGMFGQRVPLATLITLAAAAVRVERNEMLYEAASLIFLAGWNAALSAKDFVNEITADDL